MLEFSKHLVECWSHDEQDLMALSDKLVRSPISSRRFFAVPGWFSRCAQRNPFRIGRSAKRHVRWRGASNACAFFPRPAAQRGRPYPWRVNPTTRASPQLYPRP